MSNHEHDRRNRADEHLGALSPGSTATGDPSTSEHRRLADYGNVRPPKVTRSPANPDALIRGQRVTTAHDMEPGPLTRGTVGGGAMMDRTEHPEEPAEGTDAPQYTEENGDDDSDSSAEDHRTDAATGSA